MGSFSIWHWVIVLVVVLVLFGGGGKLSGIMGDLGTGIRSLKKNLKGEKNDDDEDDDVIDVPIKKVGAKKSAYPKKTSTAKKKTTRTKK